MWGGRLVHRWIVRTGLGLFAALTLAAAGCSADPGGTANEVTAADPGFVLAASTDALEQEPYQVEMTMGDLMTAAGFVDPMAEATSLEVSIGAEGIQMTVEAIVIGDDIWTNLGDLDAMLGVETEWMHIDQARLGDEGVFGLAPDQLDVAGAAEMLKGLDTVEQVDAHTFEGEIDLAESAPTAYRDQLLEALGEGSTTVEFVATVDDQGRLTHLVITLPPHPDLPADQLEMRYFDFGTPVEIAPPPADQVSELPAEFYDMFPR
jgi:hypothetical protein